MSNTSGQKDPSMDEILGSIRRIISEDNAQAGQPVLAAKEATAAADDDILDLTDALESTAEPEMRREPILKAVEATVADDGEEAQGERREPVLGIHSPAPEAAPTPEAAPAAEPPPDEPVAVASAAMPDAELEQPAPDIAAASATTGQEEEVVMAAPDEPPAPPVEQPESVGEDIVSETTSSATTAALSELSRAVEEKASRLRLGEGDVTVSDIVKELLRPMLREWIDRNLPAIVEKVVRREIQKLVDRAPGGD